MFDSFHNDLKAVIDECYAVLKKRHERKTTKMAEQRASYQNVADRKGDFESDNEAPIFGGVLELILVKNVH